MSETTTITCDVCGATIDGDTPRRYCERPWMTVSDGGVTEDVCSPECLARLAVRLGAK